MNGDFIWFKGFYIKNDYYNGIILAFLYNLKGKTCEEGNESIADYIIAERLRKRVINLCIDLYESRSFKDRSDQYWIVATLDEAYFALGNTDD